MHGPLKIEADDLESMFENERLSAGGAAAAAAAAAQKAMAR